VALLWLVGYSCGSWGDCDFRTCGQSVGDEIVGDYKGLQRNIMAGVIIGIMLWCAVFLAAWLSSGWLGILFSVVAIVIGRLGFKSLVNYNDEMKKVKPN